MALNAEQFLNVVNNTDRSLFQNEADRIHARDAVTALLQRLRTPFETCAEHAYVHPLNSAALKIAIDLGLFREWCKVNEGGPLEDDKIFSLVKADEMFMGRLLRHLTATNYIKAVNPHTHELTPFTKALADSSYSSFFSFLYSQTGPGFSNLPKYLASTDYKDPVDPNFTNWHHMTGLGMFEYAAKNPEILKDFQNVMSVNNANRPSWTDVYDTNLLTTDAKPGEVVAVDVGGGTGPDIEKLRMKHSGLPDGSLVLQDRPEVIAKAEISLPIKAENYDFFEPQPIKGARAYYMHRVLHDWPDDAAVKILKNQALAMQKGHSRLLIYEHVVDPVEKNYMVTGADMSMMMLAGKERTEEMWKTLLDTAGLRILKIWSIPESAERVIEAELAER